VLKYLPQAEQLVEQVAAATPLGRIGQPEDIAGVVAMLASEDARWINGQVVVADGGLSAV
jgi:3-oxoacyl-[acyl-carrier protein] reductase